MTPIARPRSGCSQMPGQLRRPGIGLRCEGQASMDDGQLVAGVDLEADRVPDAPRGFRVVT
jgi:hypothetical protein